VGKKLAYAAGSMAFVILAMHRQTEWSKDELIVYHTYTGIIIDVSQGGNCMAILHGSLTKDQVDFAARGYRCRRDFINIVPASSSEHLIFQKIKLENTMLTLPLSSLSIFNNGSAHACAPEDHSWLLVQQADSIGVLQHILCRSPDLRVILPASIPRPSKRKLTRLLNEQGIWYYDIDQSGYFRLDL
ncbi:MAG TPA: hypothetical protein VJ508_07535, partial [Saprospiraceae bacterium]|nr:hypothetical protein [Saprospiraceae bacterium]